MRGRSQCACSRLRNPREVANLPSHYYIRLQSLKLYYLALSSLSSSTCSTVVGLRCKDGVVLVGGGTRVCGVSA